MIERATERETGTTRKSLMKDEYLLSVLFSDALRKTRSRSLFFLLQLAKYEITTVKVKINGKASNFTEMKGSLLERIQLCWIAGNGTTCYTSFLSISRSRSQIVKNSNLHWEYKPVYQSESTESFHGTDHCSWLKANISRCHSPTSKSVAHRITEIRLEEVWSLSQFHVCLLFRLHYEQRGYRWRENSCRNSITVKMKACSTRDLEELFLWPLELNRFTMTTHQSCLRKSTLITWLIITRKLKVAWEILEWLQQSLTETNQDEIR